MNKIYLLIGCLLALSSSADAAVLTRRLCAETDLAGTYKLMDLKETPKDEEAAWFHDYGYQYFIFHPGHTYDFVASRRAMKDPGDLQKAINMSAGVGERVAERKYTLDESGVLNLYLDGKLDYSYRCMVAVTVAGNDQIGDVMLDGYSKRRTELAKMLRHWQ